MSIPGYDLDDLDDKLIELVEQRGPEELLTGDALQRYEQGERLFDILNGDEINALIRSSESSET